MKGLQLEIGQEGEMVTIPLAEYERLLFIESLNAKFNYGKCNNESTINKKDTI